MAEPPRRGGIFQRGRGVSWKRKAGYGVALILLLAAIWVAAVMIWKPWVPPAVFAEPGQTGRRINEGGLLANYYPARKHGPAVLLLGGSEGGIAGTRIALELQRKGFSVLQPSYFRGPGQSKRLELVPLEYFGTALAWLKRQPEVDPERIGVVGGSKGAEAALLLATRHPEIKAVVAGMPSSVVWPGIDWDSFDNKIGSSWSEGGHPLPYVPYGKFGWSFDLRAVYAEGLVHLAAHQDAIIPIERASAAVLLICGEADSLWPSCPMARQVVERARTRGHHPAVSLLNYRDAGHAVFGQPVDVGSAGYKRLSRTGGSPEGNNRARSDGWPKMLRFLDEKLKNQPNNSSSRLMKLVQERSAAS
jgi:dienelactone hydrolase